MFKLRVRSPAATARRQTGRQQGVQQDASERCETEPLPMITGREAKILLEHQVKEN